MSSLFSFATRAGRSRDILQKQIIELKTNLPRYVTALDDSPSQGPAEWLISKLDGCPCGNCGIDANDGEGSSSSSRAKPASTSKKEPCWFVDTTIKAPSDDPCYRGAYRLRVIVAPNFGTEVAMQAASHGEGWPLICKFMGAETTPLHLGVDQDDGSVKDEMLELFSESSTLGAEAQPGSLAGALLVCHRLLSATPPEEVFGPTTPATTLAATTASTELAPEPSEVHLKWMSFAAAHKSRAETLASYRGDTDSAGLFKNAALIHPSLAPSASDLEAWGPASALAQEYFRGSAILDPGLFAALGALRAGDESALALLLRAESPGVHSFPLFTEGFCEALVGELAAFEASGLAASRPNSMNNYGVVVNTIGLGPFMDQLQEVVVKPVSERLFGSRRTRQADDDDDDDDDGGSSEAGTVREGDWLDSHHSFSVRYTAGEDLGLDVHTDDSDVTFNICLGEPGFEGSGLVFCGGLGAPDHRGFKQRYQHGVGRCVVHLGRQRHGADDITAGVRTNLIMWNKSMAYRRMRALNPPPYEREEAPPSAECLSFTHDRDYNSQAATFAERGAFHSEGAKVTLKPRPVFAPQGWCPPPGKEYRPHPLSHLP